MENIVEKYIDTILYIVNEVKKNYTKSSEEIKTTTQEQEDIEHEIELDEKADRTIGYRYYRELRDIRRRRRMAKNQNELLQEIYNYFTTDNNKTFLDRLSQIKGNTRKTFEKQNERVYTPRIRGDAAITSSSVGAAFEGMLDDFKNNEKIVKKKKRG
jgi:hypothetical protein